MKLYSIFIAIGLLFAISCKENTSTEITTNDVMNTQSADGKSNAALPEMKFEEETHDFGRITQGEKVAFGFKFKNEGGSNLIISSAVSFIFPTTVSSTSTLELTLVTMELTFSVTKLTLSMAD